MTSSAVGRITSNRGFLFVVLAVAGRSFLSWGVSGIIARFVRTDSQRRGRQGFDIVARRRRSHLRPSRLLSGNGCCGERLMLRFAPPGGSPAASPRYGALALQVQQFVHGVESPVLMAVRMRVHQLFF